MVKQENREGIFLGRRVELEGKRDSRLGFKEQSWASAGEQGQARSRGFRWQHGEAGLVRPSLTAGTGSDRVHPCCGVGWGVVSERGRRPVCWECTCSLEWARLPLLSLEIPDAPGESAPHFDLLQDLRGKGHWEGGFSREQ